MRRRSRRGAMAASGMTARPKSCVRPAAVLLSGLAVVAAAGVCEFAAATAAVETDAETEAPAAAAAGEQRVQEEQWGVRVLGVRLSADGHILDFRYRILDAG